MIGTWCTFLVKLGWPDYGVFDDSHHRPCMFLTVDSSLPRLKLTFRKSFFWRFQGSTRGQRQHHVDDMLSAKFHTRPWLRKLTPYEQLRQAPRYCGPKLICFKLLTLNTWWLIIFGVRVLHQDSVLAKKHSRIMQQIPTL